MPYTFNENFLDSVIQIRNINGKHNSFSTCLKESGELYFNSSTPKIDSFPHILGASSIQLDKSTNFSSKELPWYFLVYVEKGCAKLFANNSSHIIPHNSFLLLNPNIPFEFQMYEPPFQVSMYWIEGNTMNSYIDILSDLQSDKLEQLYNTLIIYNKCSEYVSANLKQIIRLLKQPVNNLDIFLNKCLNDIFCDIIYQHTVSTESSNLPAHINRCIEYMQKEYMQIINLDTLQKALNINKYRLCHDFSEFTGSSPMQYLLKLRIEKAKEMLIQTDMTIHAIGECVGIPNTTHFINQFKKLNEITPLQFRKIISTQ